MATQTQEPRTALLTGCASGIGLHLTGAFLERGWRVVATDINADALDRLARDRGWPADRSLTRRLDVTRPADWDETFAAAIDRFGAVDVVINNAGYLAAAYVQDITPVDVDRHIDINTKGLIHGSHAAAKHFIARRRGHLINVASLAGMAPIPGISLYSASKFAARGFTLAIAEELRPYGVAVTALCPDAVQTPMLDRVERDKAAALIFSGPRTLTVADIEAAIFDRILPRRPLEVGLPGSRAMMTKIGNAFPGLSHVLMSFLEKRGLAKQASRKA